MPSPSQSSSLTGSSPSGTSGTGTPPSTTSNVNSDSNAGNNTTGSLSQTLTDINHATPTLPPVPTSASDAADSEELVDNGEIPLYVWILAGVGGLLCICCLVLLLCFVIRRNKNDDDDKKETSSDAYFNGVVMNETSGSAMYADGANEFSSTIEGVSIGGSGAYPAASDSIYQVPNFDAVSDSDTQYTKLTVQCVFYNLISR
jgi:hypothetical protein